MIVVNQRSCVPLFAGHWYLGIENREARGVQYRLWVSLQHAYMDTPLAASQPIIATARPGNDTCSYFVFSVTNAVPAVQFDLESFSNPARLLVSRNSRPGPYDSLREDRGRLACARILICTNDALPDLRGDWYVAVINRARPTPPSGSEPATALDLLPVLRAGVTITNTISSTHSGGAAFPMPTASPSFPMPRALCSVWSPSTATPTSPCGSANFPSRGFSTTWSASAPGIAPEFIEVETNSVPQPLVYGDWFVRVFSKPRAPSLTSSLPSNTPETIRRASSSTCRSSPPTAR